MTAALMIPAARSHSSRDSAAVMARRMLSRVSMSFCSNSRGVQVTHTPYTGTLSTMSCSRRSSPAMSNSSAERGAGVTGFNAFAEPDDIAERRWIWMIDEAACEGIVIASTWSSIAPDRAHVLLQRAQDSWRVPKDVDALRGGVRKHRWDRGGKTNEAPLMRWLSTTILDPAQNTPDEFRPLAANLMSMSICVAYVTNSSSNQHTKRRRRVRRRYIVP